MHKILVPVDFSSTSKNALRYGINLFKDKPLEVTILHIYGTQSRALMMKSIDSVLIRNAKEEMDNLIKEIESETPGVTFKTKLHKNYAISTIAELGNSGDYDFIVMGTKGATGLKEVFMGSVAGGVISKTSAPVIVVPLDYNFTGLNHIVFAAGNQEFSESSSQPLRKVVKLHNSALEVLHISDNDTFNVENSLSTIKDLNPTYTCKDSDGDLNQQLNVHIQNNDTDLLCLVRTKKDFFGRLFGGSVTLKQTFNSSVPILVIQA